jgi:hypothetical protein
MEKVVVHFRDGRLEKGYAAALSPNEPAFEMTTVEHPDEPISIRIESLKAVFFVKDFTGDSSYAESKVFAPGVPPRPGRVAFHMEDGEVLVGVVADYQPDRAGFLLTPVDPQSNNARCFVVAAAISRASVL